MPTIATCLHDCGWRPDPDSKRTFYSQANSHTTKTGHATLTRSGPDVTDDELEPDDPEADLDVKDRSDPIEPWMDKD